MFDGANVVRSDETAAVIQHDAADLPLADGTVDLVVTSPPYFALRSYRDGGEHYDGQLGSESTPQEFVDNLVACTAEWVRVSKPSGSIWVNLGDKYGEKSLMGLPWRYALACIDQLGLILRAEVIWSKPNGLPESVTDRVRRSHEQWFHFTVEPRYFAAVDEIREPHKTTPHKPGNKAGASKAVGPMSRGGHSQWEEEAQSREWASPLGRLPGSVWTVPTEPLQVPDELGVDHFAAFPQEWPRRIIQGWTAKGHVVLDPFGGTGTTAGVARALGRYGISNDLSSDYNRLAVWRIWDSGHFNKAEQRMWADRQQTLI